MTDQPTTRPSHHAASPSATSRAEPSTAAPSSSVPVLSTVSAVASAARASAAGPKKPTSWSAASTGTRARAAAATRSAAASGSDDVVLADGASLAGAVSDSTPAATPLWLIPALLLVATSVMAVGGAVFGPRLRGQLDDDGVDPFEAD